MTRQLSPAQPIQPGAGSAAARSLATDLGTVLETGGDVLFDRPGFVASDEEVNPLSAAVRAVTRFNCRRWAAADKTNFSQRVNSGNARICGPYLDTLGERPSNSVFAEPFTGGQCLARYTVRTTETRAAGVNTTTGECVGESSFTQDITGVWGPISNPRFSGSGSCANRASYRDFGVTCFGRGASPTSGPVFVVLRPGSSYYSARVVSVTRSGGLADDCGNPPPMVTPPDRPIVPPVLPPGITINLPGVGDTEVNIDLSPDGDLVLDFPDLDFSTTVEVDGGGDSGGGRDDTATEPGEPGEPESTGPGGVAEGEADEGDELVGLLVVVVGTPQSPNVFDNNPETVYRGIGYVRMGYPGRLGVDISGGTVISPQFFHSQQRGLTSWAVNANLGFNLSVTPYYRTVES